MSRIARRPNSSKTCARPQLSSGWTSRRRREPRTQSRGAGEEVTNSPCGEGQKPSWSSRPGEAGAGIHSGSDCRFAQPLWIPGFWLGASWNPLSASVQVSCPPPSPPSRPKTFPEMPPIAGVRFATAAAGIRYPRTAPTSCWRCSTRAPRSRACSPARNARRRRSIGAARDSRAAGAARWWSIPAMPTRLPARPAATPRKLTAEIAAEAGRLQDRPKCSWPPPA